MIDVEDLTVERGSVEVLADVSLSVEAGEFVALVGPNGAGKTTLLRTVNGVFSPVSGTVTVDGLDVHEQSARTVSRHVATVPQDTTVAFDFDVESVVAMGRTPYQSRFGGADHQRDRVHVDRALERTATAELRDRSIDAVSGGERQRVLLARALAQDTPALLLDEPTGSLDINHQVRTLELVADLVAEGKAVLAAVHDLNLAARYCDRLVVLAEGGVVTAGPPETVLTAGTLDGAFGADTAVATDPVTGKPSVTALGPRRDRELRVHVLGSGRVAARTISELVEAGATVTAGVLPAGDVALETARSLDVETVTAPPFAPVPESARRVAGRLVDHADVTVSTRGRDAGRRAVDPDTGLSALAARADPLVVVADGESGEGGSAATGAVAPSPDAVVGAVLAASERSELPADD